MNCRSSLLFAAIVASTTLEAQTSGPAAGSLHVAISLPSPAQTNGVAITPDGKRTFMVIPRQKGQDLPQLAEWVDGQLKPYPDQAWNKPKPLSDAASHWVHANSVRFGPDGTLWVVDFGSEGLGKPELKHGPKLVGFDIATGKITRSFLFDATTRHDSALDDVRFNGRHAYLTDAGWPGIIVLDLPTGHQYRTLTDTPTVRAPHPLRAQGKQLEDKDGKPIYFHADQLEVSPDGKLLYYQPNTGPMAVVETAALDDKNLPDSERAKHARPFAPTGTAGGTAIDAAGNIYVSDCDHSAVLMITPGGQVSTLVQDPRLIWVDAMWITSDGQLWMPAAQMNHTSSFNHGKLDVRYPMQVFTVTIGNRSPTNDHK